MVPNIAFAQDPAPAPASEYRLPPQDILDILDAPAPPSAQLSPNQKWLVIAAVSVTRGCSSPELDRVGMEKERGRVPNDLGTGVAAEGDAAVEARKLTDALAPALGFRLRLTEKPMERGPGSGGYGADRVGPWVWRVSREILSPGFVG